MLGDWERKADQCSCDGSPSEGKCERKKLPDDWLFRFPYSMKHGIINCLHIVGLLFFGASRRTLIHHFSLKSWTQGKSEQEQASLLGNTSDSACYITLLNKFSQTIAQHPMHSEPGGTALGHLLPASPCPGPCWAQHNWFLSLLLSA